MSNRDAILILRFFTDVRVILGFLMMMFIVWLMNATGVSKPESPSDIVCLGQKSYDLTVEEDRDEIIADTASFRTDPARVLKSPPCDLGGSSVSKESIDKLYGRK